MKLVEILAFAVMHGHVFHLEPGINECVQGSPSGVVVIYAPQNIKYNGENGKS